MARGSSRRVPPGTPRGLGWVRRSSAARLAVAVVALTVSVPAFIGGNSLLRRLGPAVGVHEEGKQVLLAPELTSRSSAGYGERFRTLLERNDPRMLLPGHEAAEHAARVAELPVGAASEADVRWAQRVKAASMHPSGEYIRRPLRNVAFPLVSIPIVMAFLAASSASALVLVQLFNQTYNSAFNCAHGALLQTRKRTVFRNFAVATAAACAVAVKGSYFTQTLRGDAFIARVLVSYFSVVTASVFNVGFTRKEEFLRGISVSDEEGRPLGVSKAAGRAAVAKALVTRSLLLPAVGLFLPPVLMTVVRTLCPWVLQGVVAHATVEALLVGLTLYVGFPACTAVFPQSLKIRLDKLEPAAQEEVRQTAESYGSMEPSAVYVYRGI